MTKEDFFDMTGSWYDLIYFCNDNEVLDDVACDYVFDDDMDSVICQDIEESLPYDTWTTIRDLLDEIPTGYDVYRRVGAYAFDGMDDSDFDDFRDDVLEAAISLGIIELDDNEEEEDDTYLPDTDSQDLVEGDIPIESLLMVV